MVTDSDDCGRLCFFKDGHIYALIGGLTLFHSVGSVLFPFHLGRGLDNSDLENTAELLLWDFWARP